MQAKPLSTRTHARPIDSIKEASPKDGAPLRLLHPAGRLRRGASYGFVGGGRRRPGAGRAIPGLTPHTHTHMHMCPHSTPPLLTPGGGGGRPRRRVPARGKRGAGQGRDRHRDLRGPQSHRLPRRLVQQVRLCGWRSVGRDASRPFSDPRLLFYILTESQLRRAG